MSDAEQYCDRIGKVISDYMESMNEILLELISLHGYPDGTMLDKVRLVEGVKELIAAKPHMSQAAAFFMLDPGTKKKFETIKDILDGRIIP